MGDVVDFTARKADRAKDKPKITIDSVIRDSIDFLLGDWEKMARTNRLNDYFMQSLPQLTTDERRVNYMSDLNEVAKIEANLELFPMVFFPGTTRTEQLGWVVQYRVGNDMICTPELASECYARCFGILLYLSTKRAAIDAGIWK